MSFADKVIAFNSSLRFEGRLPRGVEIMNPFLENHDALTASSLFYKKYYNDGSPRRIMLGINPGRFGAGLTGVPFTDPKRLLEKCGISDYSGPITHEPSSVFIYDMIDAYGGPQKFYSEFYINSICPLGFTAQSATGRQVNYNYYDSKELTLAVRDFIVRTLREQLEFGMRTDACFCLGTGKNEKFLSELNKEYGFFERIVPLEHPRYIMQYKTKLKQNYIDKYLAAFGDDGTI